VVGILSNRLPQSQYFYHFNAEDFLGSLLELEDIVAAFGLRRLNRVPVARTGGGIRVLAGDGAGLGAGDVVLAGPGDGVVRAAEAAGAQAVIFADGGLADARRRAGGAKVPVYHFRGSLLALASGLSLAIPVRNIMATEFAAVRADQRVAAVRDLVTKTPYALPVLNADGTLAGIFSRTEALTPEARPLIVVDHFERAQAVVGIEQAQIVEIIDHHRVGQLETLQPIRVDCRPVGSTATIVACHYDEAGLKPGQAEALLLLGAICSDTLALTSPTTTAVDRRVARELARRAGVNFADFSREVLRQNDELAAGDPAALVEKDLKEFAHGGVKFAAAQIETVDLGLLTAARREALLPALDAVRARLGVAFAALIVTDVCRSESRMFVSDPNAVRQAWLLDGAAPATGRLHEGMVSRKKQLLPLLFRRLDTLRE
jgi:manganese-dependent inorganic pyrophosphatase